MNWLTPWTGAILAAAIIPPLILLYFLKLRRRAQPIASTLLWHRSVEDLRANVPFQRLRASLLLLLQLLALLLLILSVMQPQLEAGHAAGGKTILLIDRSASMTGTDVEGDVDRLANAKRRAKERIESLYAGGLLSKPAGETMIIPFSDRAEVYSRFSRSKKELLAAVDRIQPTHGETRIGEALKLARAYTTNVDPDSDRPVGDPATLEVFTDGGILDLGEQVLRGERMIYHRTGGASADNLSISAISVERPYDRPTAVEVFAAVLSFNEESVSCDVQLSVDDVALAVETIRVPAATRNPSTGELAPGRNNVVFTPFEQPRGAVIEVGLLRDDHLRADNVAHVVVPPPKRLTVALVAPKSFVLRSVLEGMSLRAVEVLTADDYVDKAEKGGLDAYDVIVFDDAVPPEGQMPPGRYLTFGPAPPLKGLNEFGDGGADIVLSTREEHPALRFVNLDNLFIAKRRLIQPADDVTVLAGGSQGAIIVAISRGPMQAIHVAFDPVDSNWPFLRSFVTFVVNAVEHLGHAGEGLTSEGFRVGEALTTRLPAGADDILLETPDGSTIPLAPADPTMLSWGPIRLTGLHRLTWREPGAEEPARRPFAVNLLSEPEGRMDVVEELHLGQERVEGKSADAAAYTPLWPYAIVCCLAVLMLEWWVYHRKVYV